MLRKQIEHRTNKKTLDGGKKGELSRDSEDEDKDTKGARRRKTGDWEWREGDAEESVGNRGNATGTKEARRNQTNHKTREIWKQTQTGEGRGGAHVRMVGLQRRHQRCSRTDQPCTDRQIAGITSRTMDKSPNLRVLRGAAITARRAAAARPASPPIPRRRRRRLLLGPGSRDWARGPGTEDRRPRCPRRRHPRKLLPCSG